MPIPAKQAFIDEELTHSLIALFVYRGVVKTEIEKILAETPDITYPTKISFTVSGTLKDATTAFEGTGQIRLINSGKQGKGGGKGKGGGAE
jgi:hypothetical protein